MNHHHEEVWTARDVALDRPELSVIARSMIVARRALPGPLPAELLHDPALDLLLNLFVASTSDRAMEQDVLIATTTVLPSVATRWIDVLIDYRLVERTASGVALTETGDAAVVATLRSVAQSQWHLEDVQ